MFLCDSEQTVYLPDMSPTSGTQQAVPLKCWGRGRHLIALKDIHLPCSILPNRKLQLNSEERRVRLLERHDESKLFSTYTDDDDQNNSCYNSTYGNPMKNDISNNDSVEKFESNAANLMQCVSVKDTSRMQEFLKTFDTSSSDSIYDNISDRKVATFESDKMDHATNHLQVSESQNQFQFNSYKVSCDNYHSASNRLHDKFQNIDISHGRRVTNDTYKYDDKKFFTNVKGNLANEDIDACCDNAKSYNCQSNEHLNVGSSTSSLGKNESDADFKESHSENSDISYEIDILKLAAHPLKSKKHDEWNDPHLHSNNKKYTKSKIKKKKVRNVTSNFLQDDSDSDVSSQMDDSFFRSLMQRRNLSAKTDCVGLENELQFPSLLSYKQRQKGNVHHRRDCCKGSGESSPITLKSVANIIKSSDENNPCENDKPCENKPSVSMKIYTPESKGLLIENIPVGVDDVTIEQFLSGFGKILHIEMIQSNGSLNARIMMDAKSDLDWIISCINESEPFGAESSGQLKCKRITNQ